LEYDRLTDILRVAVERNAEAGLTGVLCFGGGIFVQALEGDRTVVNRLYSSIARDPRHGDCQILDGRSITTRDFAEWSMKLIGWDDVPTASRRALLLRHSGSTAFDPRQMRGPQAIGFLRDLAASERRAAA